MAGKSNIEWTGHTWNPFAGCAVLSPGCTNCYAMKMAARLDAMGQELYRGLTKPSKGGAVWRGTVRANPDALLAPLKRKKPTIYFVNSMSDLFYEKFADELIDQVFAVMALCPQHTFQVLTKRAARMRDYFTKPHSAPNISLWQSGVCWAVDDLVPLRTDSSRAARDQILRGPLPNVWLGVSTERQQEADERISHLLQTPAAVRFISAEPLLGPIDLRSINLPTGYRCDALSSRRDGIFVASPSTLDWVIVGGESGHDARFMELEWAQSLRDQCNAAAVPFFFKQWGAWEPGDGDCLGQQYYKVGKKAAGRLLDGRTHDAMPKVTA